MDEALRVAPSEIDQEFFDICLLEIDTDRSHYAPEVKLQAVIHFMLTGSVKEAADHVGVPLKTVSEWKRRTEWWPRMLNEVRKSKQDELDSALTTAIHSAVGEIADRLQHGDWVLTRTGEQVRVPVKARDASVVMNTLYEKRSLIRGDLPSIKDEARKDALKELELRFTSIARNLQEKDVVAEQSPVDEIPRLKG